MSELTAAPTPAQQESGSDFLSRPLLSAINLDWEKAIYIAFVVLAIVTRFWGLGDRVVSHDESLHTQYSYQYYNGDGYVHSPLMHGPSLFHATALSYWLFGDSDFSSRVPVAILGVILILIPYFLRDWLGRVGALTTSFIFLISPYITYYSRYIRHDIYLITFALIVFIATWRYLSDRRDRYIWWFVFGTVMMFATMEASFIYVAIFGSFLVIRLLALLTQAPWLREVLPALRPAILIVLAAVLLIGVGFGAHLLTRQEGEIAATGQATEGFAVDPAAATATAASTEAQGSRITQWMELIGIGMLSLGLFLAARAMRPHIDQYPEFDLIILFTTLVLPLASPFLVRIAGWNPQDYTINTCILEGQETMGGLQILLARAFNSTCINAFLTSGVVRSGIFLMITLAISVLVGLWWDRRRWLIAALIFNGIFLLLFTSVFTNLGGWRTGMIGSLGYWLEQQGVRRGSQPWFYYLFVTPFYEFLPVIFSIAGIYLWTRLNRLNKIVWYWVLLILAATLAYSLSNWLFNRNLLAPEDQSSIPGLLAGAAILGVGGLYWFLFRRRQVARSYGLENGLLELVQIPALVAFVPSLIWWMVATWVGYSMAGEKMPWLSTHFVIPMALLSGWFMNEKLRGVDAQTLFSRRSLSAIGLTSLAIVAVLLALGPVLLGKIQPGNQELQNLAQTGRFLGGLILAGLVIYFWQMVYRRLAPAMRSVVVTLSVFLLLSLLTIRFTYMSSFVNYDYTNEFMVYAHGAPATKSVVLSQLEELSMRLHGDKSIRVAYDSDVSWPYTWYLRDYPNRVFFGDNPSQSLNDSPVVIVGRKNWDKVDPFLANNYTSRDYTFLWWPMEQYRQISWNAIFGNPSDEVRRGLGNPDVRQALWDIFFYRDYKKYGEVFGGTYTAGQWPLRHDLRLYIRRDVQANIWEHGVGAVSAAGLEDAYAGNELSLSPVMTLNESGVAGNAQGAFAGPRNVALGPDGLIYVADSGNHRIQVFDQAGNFLRAWGSFGPEEGQFNEPWGLAVDDAFVYVADTWNHRIQKFTLEGEFVGAYGQSGAPSGQDGDGGLGLFFGPRSIVVLGEDQLLVTDTGNHRLQLMDRDGNFLRSIGSFGNLPGQFNEPVGLAVGPDGSVYVADTWNGRIQRLNGTDLLPESEWRVEAWYGQSINNKPYLATDSDGRVYATDPEGYRVLIFSPSGGYLNRFGQFGSEAGSFALPNGIAVDQDGFIYIADSGNNRLLKFPPIYAIIESDEQGEIEDSAPPADEAGASIEPTVGLEPTADAIGE